VSAAIGRPVGAPLPGRPAAGAGVPGAGERGSADLHGPDLLARAHPVVEGAADLSDIRFGADGLVVAVVQEIETRDVLMVAYMDGEALRRTLESGRTWYWSRSRSEYWCKGETSGNRQWVRRVAYDCDGDAVLVEVEQEGRGACHTGQRTCFYRAFGEET